MANGVEHNFEWVDLPKLVADAPDWLREWAEAVESDKILGRRSTSAGTSNDRGGGLTNARDTVGTLGWAKAKDGVLRPRDRLRLLGQGVLSQVPEFGRQVGGRIGLRPRRLARFDLEDLRVPDSAAAREAEEICSRLRPELLVNHSYRTYLWASVVAAHEGLRYDEEILYVSSLLHDLGLSEGVEVKVGSCFTLVGVQACKDIGQHGWSQERAERAAEAITLHMNLRVRRQEGVEAYLITAGTQLDVIGSGYWRVDPRTVAAVLERYPRLGVKTGMLEIFKQQARVHPSTRARFYWRYLGLPLLIRAAPFEQ